MPAKDQKNIAALPGVKEWLRAQASEMVGSGRHGQALIINAALAAFRALSEPERRRWMGEVVASADFDSVAAPPTPEPAAAEPTTPRARRAAAELAEAAEKTSGGVRSSRR